MRTLCCLLLVAAAPLARAASAQDLLEDAKAQYAAAAYEDALATLARTGADANRVSVEQYRAFCFIALGRLEDAERAVAALVNEDPTYVPSPSVASPKVLSLVSDMRRKELPAIARRVFDEGRTAFQEKDEARAQRSFDLLLTLLDDPAMAGRPGNDDLRVLAEGFTALLDAKTATPPAPAAPSPAPARVDTVIQGPVAVRQPLPEWIPPDAIAASRDYTGAVKVIIGPDGRVKSASIERASYPSYDARLLQAAREWVYQPATRNGEAVESEKIVAIQLRRRQ